MNTRQNGRCGTVAIAVMVCMLIVTTLAVSTLRSAMRARRETRRGRQLQQTELLLDAGVLRAVERLATDKDYAGETWALRDVFPQFGAAEIEIRFIDDTSTEQDAVEQSQICEVIARIILDGKRATSTQRSRRFSRDIQDNEIQLKPYED